MANNNVMRNQNNNRLLLVLLSAVSMYLNYTLRILRIE